MAGTKLKKEHFVHYEHCWIVHTSIHRLSELPITAGEEVVGGSGGARRLLRCTTPPSGGGGLRYSCAFAKASVDVPGLSGPLSLAETSAPPCGLSRYCRCAGSVSHTAAIQTHTCAMCFQDDRRVKLEREHFGIQFCPKDVLYLRCSYEGFWDKTVV